MTLICGVNPVLEALAAGTRHFDRLLIVKGLRGRRLAEAVHRATCLGIPLRFEMRETLDRLAGGVPHQGIIAVVSEKPLLSLEDLLDVARQPALLVALDGVEDPRNLGAILRSVEAAGADGVLLPERHSAGLSETVARASAGAIEHVRVARVGNLVQALEELKSRGIWVVGFDAAGSERWDAVDLNRPVALVLGGEGRGMRRLVREHCDHLASIPHFGHVGSLNVSVAAGIALYEAVRQRKAVPSFVRPIPQRPAAPLVIGPAPDDAGDEGDALDLRGGSQHGGRTAEPEDEGEPAASAPPHLDFHDDVAWGPGPTMLKAVEFRHVHRPGRGGKGGRRRVAKRQGEGAPRGAGSTAAPRDAGVAGNDTPRRGHRRRRGRPDGASPAAGRSDANGGSEAPSEPSTRTAERGPSDPGQGGEAQPGRRHRRRRRRPR